MKASSTMAYYSVPGNDIHCACKSFLNVFAESLTAEMICTNIKFLRRLLLEELFQIKIINII